MPKVTSVASTAVGGKGAVLELSFDGGTTYLPLPGLDTIPQLGSEGEFVRQDDIDELTESYGKGILTPSSFELVCRRIGSDSTQDLLLADARDNTNNDVVKVQVTYQSGDIVTADVLFNGVFMQEIANDSSRQFFLVRGQQSSAAVWTKVA